MKIRPSRPAETMARNALALAVIGALTAAGPVVPGFSPAEGGAPGAPGPAAAPRSPAAIRVAHMPNLTHAPALVGRARGDFERAVAPARVDWKVFNAGPSEIEALFAGELDLAYIGPSPAVNGYVKSRGEALRLVSGVAEGGASLVGRRESGFLKAEDLAGRRIATPQLGNTQDVALRHWISTRGRRTADKGGDVTVLPMANADHLTLFQKGELDGSWTVEPWVSRLVREGGGVILLDERTIWPGHRNPTTVLIVRTAFLKSSPDVVRRWLTAQEDLLGWMKARPDSARALVNDQLARLTGKPLPPGLIEEAWPRLDFGSDPCLPAILEGAEWARDLGFLNLKGADLKGLTDLGLLNDVRRRRGLPEIR